MQAAAPPETPDILLTRDDPPASLVERFMSDRFATGVGRFTVEHVLGGTIQESDDTDLELIHMSSEGLNSTIEVDPDRFYADLVKRKALGFLSQYVDGSMRPVPGHTTLPEETSVGDPESDAMVTVQRAWMRRMKPLREINAAIANVLNIGGLRDKVSGLLNPPDLDRDQDRIKNHYDRLDERLAPPKGILGDKLSMYSSGVMGEGVETIDEADQMKADIIIDWMEIPEPEEQEWVEVLDPGAGWGGMAKALLDQKPNVHVTMLVLSPAQKQHLEDRFSGPEYEGRVNILLEDYRVHAAKDENQQKYDRIVSLEMNEHTPWQEFDESFIGGQKAMLKPGGNIVIQAIIDEQRLHEVHKHNRYDYFKREVSPGVNLHTRRAFVEDGFLEHGMTLENEIDLTKDYQLYIKGLRERLFENHPDMPAPERRWWIAYFTGFEAALLDGGTKEWMGKFKDNAEQS